jgi:perosamine synthetase
MIRIARPSLAAEDVRAAVAVLQSAWLKQGGIVRDVEARLAGTVGAEKVLLVSSCTAALYMALQRIDVGDREVVVPALGFGAPIAAIIAAGGIPVFADCSPEAPLICPGSVQTRIGEQTKAILPIHLYGFPCDVKALKAVVDKQGIEIVEDVAYGLETKVKESSAGAMGRFGCMSFGASKPITSGEGGALFCSALDRSELEPCREYGISRQPEGNQFTHVGLNFRITEFQAALIMSQLDRAERIFGRLSELHGLYERRLRQAGVGEPVHSPWGTANNSCFVIALPKGFPSASEVRRRLAKRGVEAETGLLMHRMPAYKRFIRQGHSFPHAEKWAERILRLPLYPAFDEESLESVIKTLNEVIRHE